MLLRRAQRCQKPWLHVLDRITKYAPLFPFCKSCLAYGLFGEFRPWYHIAALIPAMAQPGHVDEVHSALAVLIFYTGSGTLLVSWKANVAQSNLFEPGHASIDSAVRRLVT